MSKQNEMPPTVGLGSSDLFGAAKGAIEAWNVLTDTTCVNHTDSERTACPVCLVAQLRADCENETKWAAQYLADSIAHKARADKAEAELAAERARLNWVFRNCKVIADDCTTENRYTYVVHDLEDLGAAMNEDAKSTSHLGRQKVFPRIQEKKVKK
jgi:hypothetical protein